ncbi:MAG: type III-A CRISPR-associated protein Csm2 [Ignavibacteria bacterium]|nr:type III-A CRISPR-associated protein Csm2 [Ignavibacteria bacterium]
MEQIPDLATLNGELLDNIAKREGENYRKIKTNQIRNVFSHINHLKSKLLKEPNKLDELKDELILLKPKLAYAKGRHPIVQPFQEFMFKVIDSTVNSSDFQKALKNFFVLVEAIVAYHKFFGGREN